MSSPEERRKAQLKGMSVPGVNGCLAKLLAYFDEHEPAVADAIRFGLVNVRKGQDYPLYRIAEEGEHHDFNMPHDIRFTGTEGCPPNCPANTQNR